MKTTYNPLPGKLNKEKTKLSEFKNDAGLCTVDAFSNMVSTGKTITGNAGTAAIVRVDKTNPNAPQLVFTIPKGDKGETGKRGSQFQNFARNPNDPLVMEDFLYNGGIEGDMVIDVVAGDLYQYSDVTEGDKFKHIARLKGAQGVQGDPAKILTLNGDPNNIEAVPPNAGLNGLVINTVNGDLYQQRPAGNGKVYQFVYNVKGDPGIQGPAGATGAKGDTGAQGPIGPKGEPGTTDYNALQNKPVIPTNTTQLTNGAGFQTSSNVDIKVSAHNSLGTAHNDIRTALNGKAEVPSLKNVLTGLSNGDVVSLTNPTTITFTNPSHAVAVIELRVVYTSGAVTWGGCQFIGDDLSVGTTAPALNPGTTGFVCTWSNSLNKWLVKAIYKY